MPKTETPKLSRPGLLKMSVEEAKKAGQKYAAFITSVRAEVIKSGVKEDQIRDLMKDMAALGDCGSGVMCVILT